jgi:hypothetical protein
MHMENDSAGHKYVELELSDTDRLRITFLPEEDSAYGKPSIRCQIRVNGRPPRRGPEVPCESWSELIQAVGFLRRAE